MVISARCERSREAISLRADGNLSLFERRLLDRHLRGCTDCRSFATSVGEQTRLLRAAPLEALPAPIAIPGSDGPRVGRRVAGVLSAAGAVAAAVAGAVLFAQHPSGAGNPSTLSSARATSTVAVEVATPAAQGTTEVPRPALLTAPVDSAVRGFFSIPA